MAKCPWYKRNAKIGNITHINKQGALCNNDCPKGIDENCNIIKHKPRTKLVKVKAWACEYTDRAGRKKLVASTINFAHIRGVSVKTFRCHLVADRKYLKGGEK